MSPGRTIQIEIVQADFQQALDAFAADRFDIAIKHAEDGTQKLREFKETESTSFPSLPSVQQPFLDV